MTQSSQFGHAIADSISGVYKSGGEQPLSETHACMVWEDILLCLWHVTPDAVLKHLAVARFLSNAGISGNATASGSAGCTWIILAVLSRLCMGSSTHTLSKGFA